MVHIEKMILKGFKSFRNKTVINFDKGFTAIVGINGSGKSNIIDAFVFVLGTLSAKKLRANKTSDLISNGGNGLKPAKTATVKIIFDNADKTFPTDRPKVSITRQINQEGRGIYKLNDKRTTRTEIRNMLDLAGMLPNSSNMIMQGKLFKLINMNETERRELIEDIAGIASYNEKKEKAEKELEKIQENLGNISLLLNEVYLQMDELEKEKKDAEKFIELDDEEKVRKNAILKLQIKKARQKIDKMKHGKKEIQEKISEIQRKKGENTKEIQELGQKIGELKKQIKGVENSELMQLTRNRKKLQKTITELKTTINLSQKNLEKVKEERQKSLKLLNKLKNEEVELEKEIKSVLTKRKKKKEKIEVQKIKLEEKEKALSEIDAQFMEIKKIKKEKDKIREEIKDKISKKNTKIQVLQNQINNITNSKKKLKSQIKRNHKKIENLHQKIDTLEKKKKKQLGLEDMNKINQKNIEKKMDRINQKIAKIKKNKNRLKQGYLKAQKKLMELKSEIKMKKRFSSGSRAIKAIYKAKRNREINGIYGTIAKLGSTDPKFNTAMEMAAGSRFNYVVVDDARTAEQCIKYLKRNKLGRASFIPLNNIKTYSFRGNLPSDPKIYGKAVDLISFDPKYKKAFDYIFGNTIIVEDIRTARKLRIKANRVTLDGDKVSSSNLMTGGQKQKSRGLGFQSNDEEKLMEVEKEFENYKQALDFNDQKIDKLKAEVSRLYNIKLSGQNKTKHLDKEITIAESNIKQLKEIIKEHKEEIEEINKKIENYQREYSEREQEKKKLQNELNSIEKEINQINQELSQSNETELKEQLKDAEKNLKKLNEDLNKIQIKYTKLQTKLEENIVKSKKDTQNIIKEREHTIEETKQNLDNSNQTLEMKEKNLQELVKKITEKSEILSDLLKKKKDIKYKISDLKSQNGLLETKIHPLNLKINKYELKTEEKSKKINEWRCKIDPEVIIPEEEMNCSLNKHKKRLEKIIEQKTELGAINMKAIDKYNKCEKRFNELELKNEQVIQEKQGILDFIEELEDEKKKVFMNTFNSINENFAYIFSKLSPDGEAKLELENEEDPFMGGVNIMARPGKKKWCLTQAMSGGEKTLTIIALILGIQMHIPSPYYVLDEIDAALDDANAALVADMIKDLSKDSQFVIITHRDVTMTRVDQLLGVSNQEGVSSAVNLSIRKALKVFEKNQANDKAVKA